MKRKNLKIKNSEWARYFRVLLYFSLFTFHFSLLTAYAQRDYFTPEEIELIRDAQEIDRRINVLTHAIDRRFEALKINVAAPKIAAKEKGDWGELPPGTRFELLIDVKRILQKAIDDIDSLAERPDSGYLPDPSDKKAKSSVELFPIAMRNLAAAAKRYQSVLKAELDKQNDNAEKGSILDALDSCDQIIAAVAKLPQDVPKTNGKKH